MIVQLLTSAPPQRDPKTSTNDLEYLHYNNPVKDGQEPLSIVDKSFKHILTNQPDDFHKDLLQYKTDKEPLIEAVSSR